MALSEDALVTFEEAQAQLTYLEDGDQTAVEALIESASLRANSFTGRKLKSRELTEYLDCAGGLSIKLNQFPVEEVESLNVDTSRTWATESLYAENTDYLLYSDTGIIRTLRGELPLGPRVIKVVYTAGYDTVPDDLKQAVIEIVAQALDRYRGHGVGLKSVTSSAGVNTTYEMGIPFTALQVLSSYRDYRF